MNSASEGDDVKVDPGGPRRGVRAFGQIAERIRSHFSLSPAVWSRAAALLFFLSLIKVAILWNFREHLYQIHWRVVDEHITWFNVVAFVLFAGCVGVHLWLFANECMGGGARRVRFANATVLILAGMFIFLTFHEGDKGYLFALINGVLKFKDIKWYLIMNCCFRLPFLAAWLLVYGLIYYGFWRKGREHLMLRVTAIFGVIYTLVGLWDLLGYGLALAIADTFALACLVPLRRRHSMSWVRLVLPIFLSVALFFLFSAYDQRLSFLHFRPLFAVLFWGTLAVFAAATIYALIRGFAGAWSRCFPFVFVAFLLLINSKYPIAINYRNVLCASLALPRYFLSGFLVVGVLLLLAMIYRKWRSAGSLWWMDFLSLVVIIVSLIDLRLSQIMGTRLDWDVLSLGFGETPKMMWRMAKPYLPSLMAGLAVLLAVYAGAIWFARRFEQGPRSFKPSSPSIPGQFAIVTILLLACVGKILIPSDKAEGQAIVRLIQTSPLVRGVSHPVMDQHQFATTAGQLGIDLFASPTNAVAAPQRDLNVVLIFQESTYNKHLSLFGSSEDTEPLLSNYKDRMELFPNFFSSFTGSIQARFATFTGVYPVRDFNAFTARRVPVKSIFEVLDENGYDCSLFYSSFFDYTGFRDFLRGRHLAAMYDADNMPGERTARPVSWGLQETETLKAMTQQIKTYAAANRKFFLTYIPAAPHNPFDGTPTEFQKYRQEKFNDLSPLYRNELLYMDWVIASIIDELRETGLLDKTLVVITADHGEMLGDDGGPIGHGWKVTPELQNVPLIILDPSRRGFHLNDVIGSQVDLLPTLLGRLGIPVPDGQLYEGASLDSIDPAARRTIYINSLLQYGIVEGPKFIRGERAPEVGAAEKVHETFTITNDGPRAVFEPQSNARNLPSISPFDQFQENLLFNYGEYCQKMGTAGLKR